MPSTTPLQISTMRRFLAEASVIASQRTVEDRRAGLGQGHHEEEQDEAREHERERDRATIAPCHVLRREGSRRLGLRRRGLVLWLLAHHSTLGRAHIRPSPFSASRTAKSRKR